MDFTGIFYFFLIPTLNKKCHYERTIAHNTTNLSNHAQTSNTTANNQNNNNQASTDDTTNANHLHKNKLLIHSKISKTIKIFYFHINQTNPSSSQITHIVYNTNTTTNHERRHKLVTLMLMENKKLPILCSLKSEVSFDVENENGYGC